MDKYTSIAVPVTRRSAPAKARRAGHPKTPPDDGVGGKVGDVRRKPRVEPESDSKPTHRFHVGQRLRLLGAGRNWSRAEGACRVVALMPEEAGTFHYRVRSETENFERVVAEADLVTIILP